MDNTLPGVCTSLERRTHAVVAFIAAAKYRLGMHSWSVVEPSLHSVWTQLGCEAHTQSWCEIREFVEEVWQEQDSRRAP